MPKPRDERPISELETVSSWLGSGDRIPRLGGAIRRAIDWVIDGARTRRYCLAELETSEKIYLGNRVEHEVLFELSLSKTPPLDTAICSIPVDIKFSLRTNWMIPPEATNHICVLLSADDDTSAYSCGVFHALSSYLAKPNRDRKRGILARGRSHVSWIADRLPLPRNFLLHLDSSVRDRLFALPPGQPAITQLFRTVIGKPIPKIAVDTLARQIDPHKRVRDARKALSKEGIEVLSERYDKDRIAQLGNAPIPSDCWISIRSPRIGKKPRE